MTPPASIVPSSVVVTTSPPAQPQPAQPGAKGRLLLVEDNVVNQKVALHMLVKLGYEVDLAEDGRKALERLAAARYDAVLMDCQMPEMDGYEATRQIRRAEAGTGRHLPIIAMTAAAMDGDREACLEAGMDDYITKPVSLDAVAGAIERSLGSGKPACINVMVESIAAPVIRLG